jgi:hypothetical protein
MVDEVLTGAVLVSDGEYEGSKFVRNRSYDLPDTRCRMPEINNLWLYVAFTCDPETVLPAVTF